MHRGWPLRGIFARHPSVKVKRVDVTSVDIDGRSVTTADGHSLALSSVARIERIDGPVKVDRENAQRYVVVQSNVRDRDLVGFVVESSAGLAVAQVDGGHGLGHAGQPARDVPRAAQEGQRQRQHGEGQQGGDAAGEQPFFLPEADAF